MKRNLISPRLEGIIINRNSQVVLITDLPIEWMHFKGVPFSFSHDICRLPETSLHGLMAFYAMNNSFEFTIPKDIINKTLVIFGNDEKNFVVWQKSVEQLSRKHLFKLARCKSIEEVKVAIEKFKPSLLIFDCHGEFDKAQSSTYLKIGNEDLTAQAIVQNGITAPLVFVSACGTAPVYGTFNTIANAFFEIGALAVTTTYLPISISRGSILYLRLLANLPEAATKPIHKNWLAFVCHLIRSSAIQESFFRAEFENNLERKFSLDQAEAMYESMRFERRRELFHQLDDRIQRLVKKNKSYFSNTIPEYLFYSNLGRQDLIEFASWRDLFLAKNNPEL